jgi:hypothetical protein
LRHLLLLERPEALYLGVDREPADLSTVADWLAARGGARPAGASAGAAPRPSIPSSRSNKRCSNRRLVGSGYSFRYPTFREGFETLLAEAGLA